MNSNYIYEYANLFERVLSAAYYYEYFTVSLEKKISYSSFFQYVEKSSAYAPTISENDLIKQVMPEIRVNLLSVPTYNQCLWAAEAYLRIQKEFGFTFELIFLYIPILKMYNYYLTYHEMDFSQIVDEFKRLYEEKTVLAALLDNRKISLSDLSKSTNLSYDLLFSLKSRRREISKVDVATISLLSRVFHVRMETLSELKVC